MENPPMQTKDLSTLLQLRLVVGYLGEAAQCGWWSSGFFTSSSRMFLEPVFPKTVALAQYNGVVEAARRLHDDHLSLGCFHLFRLPEEAEQDLHALAGSELGEQFVIEHLQSQDQAMSFLQTLAGGRSSGTEGPMILGKFEEPEFQAMLASMAGAYRAAFQDGFNTFPFFGSHA